MGRIARVYTKSKFDLINEVKIIFIKSENVTRLFKRDVFVVTNRVKIWSYCSDNIL